MRRAWGFRQSYANLRWKYIAEKTGLSDGTLSKTLTRLKTRNLIITFPQEGKSYTTYKINSKISTWKPLIRKQKAPSYKKVNTFLQESKKPSNRKAIPIKDKYKDKGTDTPLNPPTEKTIMTKKQIFDHDAKMVVDYINELSGKSFKHSESSLAPIRARLKDGYTLEQCFQVCLNKWNDPDHKEKYYRPTTLFRPALFEAYLNETGTKQKLSKQKTKMRSTVEAFARRHYERENSTKGN
jgi:uncharacterized phage protein (TIGR02220 family)